MKNNFFVFFLSITLVYLISYNKISLAAPSLGTVMPKKGAWQAGCGTNIVFDRDIKGYHDVDSTQYFYNLSFGFAEWFCFDGRLGIGGIGAKSTGAGFEDYRENFAGGYGWRALLFDDKQGGAKAVLGFEHISVHPSGKHINDLSYNAVWDDWQLQAVLSKDCGRVYPYLGAAWSSLYMIRWIAGNRTTRHSYDNLGFIAGADVRIAENFYINIEGRFFDETALSAGVVVRY